MGVGLGANGIRLRTKLRRESRVGHARRRTGSAVDRRIRRLNGQKPICASRTAPNPKMTAAFPRIPRRCNACADRTGRNLNGVLWRG
jgi:hypothetical protein